MKFTIFNLYHKSCDTIMSNEKYFDKNIVYFLKLSTTCNLFLNPVQSGNAVHKLVIQKFPFLLFYESRIVL